MCQGFSFLGVLLHFVLAKLATSSIRVKGKIQFVHRQSLSNGILEALQFGEKFLHSIKTEEPKEVIALPYDLELPPSGNLEYSAKVQRLISGQVNAKYY